MAENFDYASKIEALLAKAQGTDNPQEAESFTAAAEKLMVKWGINDAMLSDKKRKQKKAGESIVEKRIKFSGSFCRGEIRLAFAVGTGLGLKVLQSNGGPGEGTMVVYAYLIGYESDVMRAEMLLASLLLQAKSARQTWWKVFEGKADLSNNEAYLAKRQFIVSFATAVGLRLTVTRQEAEKEAGSGVELVLVGRNKGLDDWIGEHYPKLRNGRSMNGSEEGRAAGRKAGNEASLGGNEVKGGKAEIGA